MGDMWITKLQADSRRGNFSLTKRSKLSKYLPAGELHPQHTDKIGIHLFISQLTNTVLNVSVVDGLRIYLGTFIELGIPEVDSLANGRKFTTALIFSPTVADSKMENGVKVGCHKDNGSFFIIDDKVPTIHHPTREAVVCMVTFYRTFFFKEFGKPSAGHQTDTKSIWFSKADLEKWIVDINDQMKVNPAITDVIIHFGEYNSKEEVEYEAMGGGKVKYNVGGMLTIVFEIPGAKEKPDTKTLEEGGDYDTGMPCPPGVENCKGDILGD